MPSETVQPYVIIHANMREGEMVTHRLPADTVAVANYIVQNRPVITKIQTGFLFPYTIYELVGMKVMRELLGACNLPNLQDAIDRLLAVSPAELPEKQIISEVAK